MKAPQIKRDWGNRAHVLQAFREMFGANKAKKAGEQADKARAFVLDARSKGFTTRKEGDELIAYPRDGRPTRPTRDPQPLDRNEQYAKDMRSAIKNTKEIGRWR